MLDTHSETSSCEIDTNEQKMVDGLTESYVERILIE